jgi:ubiquinone/menaquinone biosynthesis C-methylase UbiE
VVGHEITEVLNRPISQEPLARDVTRLAYVATDGTACVGSSVGLSAAEAYERYLARAIFTPWVQDLVALAAPAIGERVLHIACGTGVVARTVGAYLGAGVKVVGLDLNAGMLEVARSLPWIAPAPVWNGGSERPRLALEDGSFDLVLCQHGLQFFP